MWPALESDLENERPARICTPSAVKKSAVISIRSAVTASPSDGSAVTGCRSLLDAATAATPGILVSASSICVVGTPFWFSIRALSNGRVEVPEFCMAHAPVAVDHRARHHEQRDRDRDFKDDEGVAPPLTNSVRRRQGAQGIGVEASRLVQRRGDSCSDAGRERDDG